MTNRMIWRAAAGGAATVAALALAPPVAARAAEEQLAELRARVSDLEPVAQKGFGIGPNTRMKIYGSVKGDVFGTGGGSFRLRHAHVERGPFNQSPVSDGRIQLAARYNF